MAIYPKAVLKLIPPDARDPLINPVLAVLHVDAGNAKSLYEWWLKNGVNECHFFVKRDGIVEQYVDTKFQADAQVGGGAKAVSIETQGYGEGEWTPEQLVAIKDLLQWLHDAEGIPLRRPASPYDSGVGYHSMWASTREGTWARDGRTCPGPDRITQYHTVLLPWMSNPTAPQEDEEMAITVKHPRTGKQVPVEDALWSMWTYILELRGTANGTAEDAKVARALAEASATEGRALTEAEIDAIGKRVGAEIAAGFDVELAPKEPVA